MAPKVTVVTPTFNRASMLTETIKSVLAQTFVDFEYLILDDGSTDDTWFVVEPFLVDGRVRYLKQANRGEAATVTWGWQLASGDYFVQVNSDDPVYPTLLQEIVLSLDVNPTALVVYSDFDHIDEFGAITKTTRSPDWEFHRHLASFSCYAASPGAAIRRSALRDLEILKDSGYRHISDVDMYWRLALRGEFIHLPRVLATWRDHSGGISFSRYEAVPEVLRWFTTYFSQIDLPSEVKALRNNCMLAVLRYCTSLIQNSKLVDKDSELRRLRIELFRSDSLQVGDRDLTGNKFNGHNLHLHWNSQGLRSYHVVKIKESNDETTSSMSETIGSFAELDASNQTLERLLVSSGTHNPIWHSLFSNPLVVFTELVHLHLVHNGIVDVNGVRALSRIKPIVWTLHDPWAMTGHCIEPDQCERWKTGCGKCPQLAAPFAISRDTTALNFALKLEALSGLGIQLVVASEYMRARVAQSPILAGNRVHVVPFGIDQNIFHPQDKRQAKIELGLDPGTKVVLFRSDTRYKKGVDYVEATIASLEVSFPVTFVSVSGVEYLKSPRHSYLDLPWITDDRTLSLVYNAADLFLMPSTIESFGMMAIEAMSCGTVPVVLEGTALPEVVGGAECGVVTIRDKAIFTATVQRLLEDDEFRLSRSIRCLEYAKKNYNFGKYVERLREVYRIAKSDFKLTVASSHLLEALSVSDFLEFPWPTISVGTPAATTVTDALPVTKDVLSVPPDVGSGISLRKLVKKMLGKLLGQRLKLRLKRIVHRVVK